MPLHLLAAARQTMYSSIYYLVVSGSEAAIRLPVRKSGSAISTTSRARPVVKDGCRLSYFTPRLDVACSKLNIEFLVQLIQWVPPISDNETRGLTSEFRRTYVLILLRQLKI